MANDRRAHLRALDRLVGTWRISGGAEGEVAYEWMDGGFFLIQRGDVLREGQQYSFLQVIGYDRAPGGEPSDELVGRLYTTSGDTLAYTCQADDEGMTIWLGERGSPQVYRGEWSDDACVLKGAWTWPGGGYDETMTRVD